MSYISIFQVTSLHGTVQYGLELEDLALGRLTLLSRGKSELGIQGIQLSGLKETKKKAKRFSFPHSFSIGRMV